jgi:hypothetical protein
MLLTMHCEGLAHLRPSVAADGDVKDGVVDAAAELDAVAEGEIEGQVEGEETVSKVTDKPPCPPPLYMLYRRPTPAPPAGRVGVGCPQGAYRR